LVTNFEFKATCQHLNILEQKLLELNPLFIGEDHQVDTYFNVSVGRLKLREGNIENALIHYERKNTASAKQSNVLLYQHSPNVFLKNILIKALGIKTIVSKKRKIYFIENVKFHFDIVENLGTFIEVEAIDKNGNIGIDKLKEQCTFYIEFFNLKNEDFIENSYSDMMMNLNT
jgi:adenylate cyclase class 2